MATLLERQVEALRVSIEPGGRWDRLASGNADQCRRVPSCSLCSLPPDDRDDCPTCPLDTIGENCDDNPESLFARWADAKSHYGYTSPKAVALAREMKALLARLLVEYEAKLKEERKNA